MFSDERIHDLVPLGEAQNLTVRISSRNLNHLFKIFSVWDIAGNMKAEESRHHDGRLSLPPIGVWFIQ